MHSSYLYSYVLFSTEFKCLEQRSHLSTLEVFIALSAVRFIWDVLDCYSELRFTVTSWQC